MNVKYSKIACIILASGVGRRFGANKLLTAIDGAPMLQHILDISQGLFAKRIVVTRHKEVAEICVQQQIPCLLHDKPYLSDTVRLGTAYVQQLLPQAEGLLFAVADQPLLQLVGKFCREDNGIAGSFFVIQAMNFLRLS